MVRVVPPGQGGSPGHTHTSRSSGGGGGSGLGPKPNLSNWQWEVTQTPHGRVVVGAVTPSGQLVRVGSPIPGYPGYQLSVPPYLLGTGPASGGGGGGGGTASGGGGGGGGSGNFTPPVSVGGSTASGPSASSQLFGVLSKMFPFITDFGNALPGQSSGISLGSTAGVIEDFAKVMGQIGALLGQFLGAVEILFTPTFWVRAFSFLIGLPAVTFGLVELGRARSGGGTALGMAAVGGGMVFLFLAFHNLPDTVNSPGSLAAFLRQEIQGGVTLTAASAPYTSGSSLMRQPLTPSGTATAASTAAGP